MATIKDKKMLDLNNNKDLPKLELDYPCSWCYKVIAHGVEPIEEAIKDVILQKPHTLKHSNQSKAGKFVSMNLGLIVDSEDERDFIFQALKDHQNIKMVL